MVNGILLYAGAAAAVGALVHARAVVPALSFMPLNAVAAGGAVL